MKKIKKYIYPIIFSLIFYILFVAIGLYLRSVLDRGSYAGAAVLVLYISIWAFLVAPIYCVIYSKIIYEEKLKALFVLYNLVIVGFSHTFLFLFNKDNLIYCIIFFVWVILWTVLPLILWWDHGRHQNEINSK